MFQEYVLAKSVSYFLGTQRVYEGFMRNQLIPACEIFFHIVDNGHVLQTNGMTDLRLQQIFVKALVALNHREEIRNSYHNFPSQSLTLSRLIHGTQWLGVTVDQDRFHALLSLMRSVAARQFSISYLQSVSDTAIRASLLIANEDPLYLLYRGIGISSVQPSWTINLQHREANTLDSCWEPGVINDLFQACGHTEFSMTIDRRALSLIIKGVRIGKVAHLSHNLTVETCMSKELHWFYETADWIKSRKASPTSCFTEEDFWRTLVADTIVQRLRIIRSSTFTNFSTSLTSFLQYVENVRQEESQPLHLQTGARSKSIDALYLDGLVLSVHRRLAVLEDGRPCLVPNKTEIGDWLTVVAGAPMPFVLRQVGDNFKIIGRCYIHDMMDGQAVQSDKDSPNFGELIIV